MNPSDRKRQTFVWKNSSWRVVLVTAPLLVACSGATAPDGSAPAPTTSAAAPPASASAAAPAPPSAAAPAPSDAPAAAPASASAAASAAPPEAPKPEEAPLPAVKVKNIGMHIGGGPHDDATKAPFNRSVEPHFDELRRCFAKVDDPKKGGDFGVDLLVDGKGGKAQVSHPRTALKGEGFVPCVVGVFESIEFLKPKGGKKTMVSYSIRFTPEGR
ncbi:hypothetical protein [Polyangium spumosum]|uniref:AgmX/PglI C-terminal domain-containing protein n=1 Tax=Polyangium spumosum TaxID=889282 RepID=A0A6N7PSM0_9BACT|nr:hypothetical protein [Polyangium spumosum]MRG93370.1 hypothetical protein [Polyangium spumosum]